MKATTTKRIFSRETEVSIDIRADREAIWSLLTDAAGYPSWNTTVLSIEGDIALGKKIALRSTMAPERTFELTVREFQAPERLVWGDAMGRRTYALEQKEPGVVTFSMHEKIGGPFFPLFARMIPSFDASFDRFASDLKLRAESREGDPS
ncbi:MAG: SRPBCC domain-containing protein [Myxococcales bacterium]|nr:SRPBCC domain-containing protein [Myxococcales bacterium]